MEITKFFDHAKTPHTLYGVLMPTTYKTVCCLYFNAGIPSNFIIKTRTDGEVARSISETAYREITPESLNKRCYGDHIYVGSWHKYKRQPILFIWK